jgi:hypothetical protein
VARSPKDRPILIVAVTQWGSGRTRVALGGFGDAPIIAMDGPDSSGVDLASRDAYYEAEDQWATAQYRREVAAKIALRCLKHLEAAKESEAEMKITLNINQQDYPLNLPEGERLLDTLRRLGIFSVK